MSEWIAVFTGSRHELTEGADNLLKNAVKLVRQRGASLYVGDANGVDALVRAQGPAVVFEADWRNFGKGAGPRRNKEMLTAALAAVGGNPLLVKLYAFPATDSRGTWDCVKTAALMGIASYVTPIKVEIPG